MVLLAVFLRIHFSSSIVNRIVNRRSTVNIGNESIWVDIRPLIMLSRYSNGSGNTLRGIDRSKSGKDTFPSCFSVPLLSFTISKFTEISDKNLKNKLWNFPNTRIAVIIWPIPRTFADGNFKIDSTYKGFFDLGTAENTLDGQIIIFEFYGILL